MSNNLFNVLERMLEETGKFRIQFLDDNDFYSAFLLEDIKLKHKGDSIIIKGINGTQKYKEVILVDDFTEIAALDEDKKFIFNIKDNFVDTYVYEVRFYIYNELTYSIRVA